MSMPLQPRRSSRNPEPRRPYADEQALRHFQQQEALEIARTIRNAEPTVEPSDSDEHELEEGERSASDCDEESPSDDENRPPWTRQLHDVHPPACTAIPLVLLPRHRVVTELGFLQCFIDPALIDTFVTNTNMYAAARQAVAWVDVTTEELWRYLAVRIRQGIVVLPDLHQYWQDGYCDSYIIQLMSRNRFLELHRYFHITPPVDRAVRQTVVEKTAPFYHQCQQLFKAYYEPGRDFALDETMIRFQGRSSWITVIKAKPTPVGYKLYTVASDGYLLDFRIYRGKGGYNSPQNVLHHVVVDLVKHWQGANRWLFCDNLYTSPDLCVELLHMGIRFCGTCRPNRSHLPKKLKKKRAKLAKGALVAWQWGQLGCVVWNDSKPVIFLSTHRRVDSLTPIPAAHGQPATTRLSVAVDYNHNKGHVDQVDQLRSYNVVERRGRRTWPALAWWLLDVCISNAYKLWCLETNSKPGLLHFREQLLVQIAAAYPSHRTHVQPTVPAIQRQPFVGHWPRRAAKRRDCAHCSEGRQHRVWTTIECAVCGVYLCVEPCFGAYHDGLGIDNRAV
jgi:hypothetical protein